MTRDSLRPLEGQLVAFSGRLADASTQLADGGRHYLLTALKCWPWDGESPVPLDQPAPVQLDHTWVTVAATVRADIEMLRRVAGVARVSWYARSDGSADLGLELLPALNLDQVVTELYEARGKTQRPVLIKQLNRLLESCQTPGNASYSQWLNRSEAIKSMVALRDRLVRSEATEQRIRLTSPQNRHRPSGPRRFADLLKTPA